MKEIEAQRWRERGTEMEREALRGRGREEKM